MGRRTESGNRFNAAQNKVVSANRKPDEPVKEQIKAEKTEDVEKTEEITAALPASEIITSEDKSGAEITEPKQSPAKNTGNIFSKQKKEHGVQQSVYLKKEVYDYCQRISEEHGIKFSDVINTIVLEYMEQN